MKNINRNNNKRVNNTTINTINKDDRVKRLKT